ncbi:MAG: hypothetical protein ACPG7P_01565, partial [Candidatus Puniceispirillaceae bacterium]
MKSLPINMPALMRARVSLGGLMLSVFALGILMPGGVDVRAQKYSANQTNGQVSGQVDLLATVQDRNSGEAA